MTSKLQHPLFIQEIFLEALLLDKAGRVTLVLASMSPPIKSQKPAERKSGQTQGGSLRKELRARLPPSATHPQPPFASHPVTAPSVALQDPPSLVSTLLSCFIQESRIKERGSFRSGRTGRKKKVGGGGERRREEKTFRFLTAHVPAGTFLYTPCCCLNSNLS